VLEMSAAKHTPGPWQYVMQAGEDWPHPQRVYVTRVDWGIVASVNVDPGMPHMVEQQRANLRLIAAAPELLKALQALEAAYESIRPFSECPEPPTGEHDIYKFRRLVRSAIAKATGGAP
jgi:hypothetical protein